MQISITGTSYGTTSGGGTRVFSVVTDLLTPAIVAAARGGGGGGKAGVTVTLLGILPEESAGGFAVAPEQQVQESARIGAADIQLLPRGNKKLTWSFTVARVHKSADEAAYFAMNYESQFPVSGKLTYTTDKGVLYYLGAFAELTRLSFEGATTLHAYRIRSGGASTSGAGAGGTATGLGPGLGYTY